jgi:FAD/FMN-containing dehydrogenase
MTTTTTDWEALRGAIAGEVVRPDAPAYDAVRTPAIARFADVRPLAAVRCAAPRDAAQALAFARREGLALAVRSGGHCFAGRSSTAGLLIDVGPLDAVALDGEVATIGAGARLGQVYDALAAQGRTLPAGCGPTVGIAGLTLGGGLGLLGRAHGTTSDQLLAAQVVLPDGRIVDCDEHHDPELFWALRGAGASGLGVVTALTFRTVPEPEATSFLLRWPVHLAAAIAVAWQDWAPSAPDAMAASLLVHVPADLDEAASVTVSGAMTAGRQETLAQLDQLVRRIGSDPASAQVRHARYREIKRHLAQLDAEQPGHPYSKNEFFSGPPAPRALDALVEELLRQRVAGEARTLDFMPWGGAYNRVPAAATAFVHREDRFLLKYEMTLAPDANDAERGAAQRRLSRLWSGMHPWGSGRSYQNFPDPRLMDEPLAYYGQNLARLERVKARYAAG